MKRVFAELDDDTENLWGYFCPFCSLYHEVEGPVAESGQHSCKDCLKKFIVTYERGHSVI